MGCVMDLERLTAARQVAGACDRIGVTPMPPAIRMQCRECDERGAGPGCLGKS